VPSFPRWLQNGFSRPVLTELNLLCWSLSSTQIDSNGLVISIIILLGMIVFVILAIHCQGWKLTKTLAALMLLFYFGFLAQAVWQELPFETCDK